MDTPINELLLIAFRVVVIYIIVLVGLRIMGKREIAQLSVIDFVLVLLISNAVQNAMLGPNNSLFGGIVAAITLFAVNYLLKLIERFGPIKKLLEGDPLQLVYNGKINRQNLSKSGISHDELMAVVREHGVDELSKVDLCMLEVNGNISVLSHNYSHRSENEHPKTKKTAGRQH